MHKNILDSCKLDLQKHCKQTDDYDLSEDVIYDPPSGSISTKNFKKLGNVEANTSNFIHSTKKTIELNSSLQIQSRNIIT